MGIQPDSGETDLSSLRTRGRVFMAFSLLFLAAGFLLISTAETQLQSMLPWLRFEGQWVLITGSVLLFENRLLWKGLKNNYREDAAEPVKRLLPDLGPGNVLTLFRGVLIAGAAGFLLAAEPAGWLRWVPSLLFTLAITADFLDGYLARISNHATQLGKSLDISFDSIMVLAGALLAVQYGQVPFWYISVALARYLFLGGIWLRTRFGLPVYELAHSPSRRGLAGVQMGFIAAVLWPVFSAPGTHIAAAAFALPFLYGFTRDWLATCGELQDHGQTSTFQKAAGPWLPVFLRILVAGLALAHIVQRFYLLTDSSAQYTIRGLPDSVPGLVVLSLAELIVLVMISLGTAGRVASAAGLCLLGVQQAFAAPSAALILLVAGYTGLLFLGTGKLSLWTPENDWILHRAGEKRPAPAKRAA